MKKFNFNKIYGLDETQFPKITPDNLKLVHNNLSLDLANLVKLTTPKIEDFDHFEWRHIPWPLPIPHVNWDLAHVNKNYNEPLRIPEIITIFKNLKMFKRRVSKQHIILFKFFYQTFYDEWCRLNSSQDITLTAFGSNKAVFAHKNRDIVYKLYTRYDKLTIEKEKYNLLLRENLDFFVPKTRFVSTNLAIQQKTKLVNMLDLNNNPLLSQAIYNNLDYYNPSNTVTLTTFNKKLDILYKIINEVVNDRGRFCMYNFGVRKNKLLLLDIENVQLDDPDRYTFLKDKINNINKLKEFLDITKLINTK